MTAEEMSIRLGEIHLAVSPVQCHQIGVSGSLMYRVKESMKLFRPGPGGCGTQPQSENID